MWLLDTATLELCEFLSTPPPYAILSHTWEDEEVTFQELKTITSQGLGGLEAKSKTGYRKIKQCCEQARSDGLVYVWVDTCCIDKRSSAELSEAINSMFRWYSEAQLCYAYLADVLLLGSDAGEAGSHTTTSYPRPVWGFPSSRWFTRGWTLQETLAPTHVIFFDKNWAEIGTKASLLEDLVEITGIPSKALMQPFNIRQHSVADRMSWASRRQTTRVEDQAYSLLGIFGVNMPLLYGEGKKAFNRLQLQILSESNDHSIFAWVIPTNLQSAGQAFSALAESPAMFAHDRTGQILQYTHPDSKLRLNPITITNLGLSVTVPIIAIPEGTLVAILDCVCGGKRVGIHVSGGIDSKQRLRSHPHELVYLELDLGKRAGAQTFYLLTELQGRPPNPRDVHIDLSLINECSPHGWDTIYLCRSGKETPSTLYCDRLWSARSVAGKEPKDLSHWEVKDLFMVPEDDWIGISFKRVDGNAFSLAFGPHAGRLWCHGITGFELLQLEACGAPVAIQAMFAEDARRFDEPAWAYFRDRVSYRLDSSRVLHIAIKLVTHSSSPRYRVEVVQQQVPDTGAGTTSRREYDATPLTKKRT